MAARIFTDEQEATLVERYVAGAFIGELADEMGSSRKAVNNALRRRGCPLRDKHEAARQSNAQRRTAGLPHPNWRGGRTMNADGYVLVEINERDPMWSMASSRRGTAWGYGYVLEHRLVMARALGRPLTAEEEVHHIDEPRSDNRIENLQLRHGRHGKGRAFQCAECGSHNIVAVAIGGS